MELFTSIMNHLKENREKRKAVQEEREREYQQWLIAFRDIYERRASFSLACSHCGWGGMAAQTWFEHFSYQDGWKVPLYDYKDGMNVLGGTLHCPRCDSVVWCCRSIEKQWSSIKDIPTTPCISSFDIPQDRWSKDKGDYQANLHFDACPHCKGQGYIGTEQSE